MRPERVLIVGFVPPPYPYDRLNDVKAIADAHPGGLVDLSIGTPCDPAPELVRAALSDSGAEVSYPPSIGTVGFRTAAAEWLNRLVGTSIGANDVRANIGSKEFVAGLPHWLKLRQPERDTVLYPSVSYPSYEMGATLAGCRAVAVPVAKDWTMDLSAIDESDAERALCLWVNAPGNPAGAIDDLAAAAQWGRSRGVPVISDECYVAFTWDQEPRSILQSGLEGVLAVHSLSKRSNLAGVRCGFYAGDGELIHYLGELRKHAGFMQPGPGQAAGVVAFGDESHVEAQRQRYWARLELMQELVAKLGADCPLPQGGFYLWVKAPSGDAWEFTRTLAESAGLLVSPGEFYGTQGAGYVRIAVVQPDEKIELAAKRLGLSFG